MMIWAINGKGRLHKALQYYTEVPSGKNFLFPRSEYGHSMDDILESALLKRCGRIQKFEHAWNRCLMDQKGIYLFILWEKVDEILC